MRMRKGVSESDAVMTKVTMALPGRLPVGDAFPEELPEGRKSERLNSTFCKCE